MNKRELIQAITDRLNETGVKKDVDYTNEVQLFNSDGDAVATIPVNISSNVSFNSQDVAAVLNLALEIIAEQIRDGKEVSVYGYFKISPVMRAQRSVKHPDTLEPITIPAHHVVKMQPGNVLKRAALELDDIDFADYYAQLLTQLSGGSVYD